MRKFVITLLGVMVLAAALAALTQAEKACVEEKRAQLQQAIDNCRKQYSDPKDISICAQAAKQEFALAVKQCYENK